MKKIIAIASDHAGYKLKQTIAEYLAKNNQLHDLGTNSEESVDYPDFALKLAKFLKTNPDAFGIAICGSGIGISIALNRYKYIRAALCHDANDAILARKHNNANVIVFGAKNNTNNNEIFESLNNFLSSEFEGGRHQRRINKLGENPMFASKTDFNYTLENNDFEIFKAIEQERNRQQNCIELIASENIVSSAVLEAQGSIMTNKYAEGYPGRRYYGGCEYVDIVENLAIERIKKLFNCNFANVQPHSGSQANQAVFLALLNTGDSILGMSLDSGGHLTHGSKVNLSGKWFDAHAYNVNKDTGIINYEEVEELAKLHKPKIIIAGGSAYPRFIDFAKFRKIADSVGAYLHVDMAHFAGLVAGGVFPNPLPYAHVVTSTTHKTLRGPRGGIVLTNEEDIAKKINSAVFPGLQGGPLMHVIAAKAVAFGEALKPEFQTYAKNVISNAKILAHELTNRGYNIFTGGTDSHLLLVDLRPQGLTGKAAQESLERAHLTCNKNSIPFDTEKPTITSGIRIGSPAATSRGFGEKEFKIVANLIADVLDGLKTNSDNNFLVEQQVQRQVIDLCNVFPIYC
jgi:glycine hydroxymethyltransferase